MKVMKVYRFRSLGDCQSLERVEQILTTGKFWCSRFWELNDPMEGIYRLNPTSTKDDIELLYKGKAGSLICSFSGEEALYSPLMWGYYANGFKGIAIEVEVQANDIEEVEYRCSLFRPKTGSNAKEAIRNLLCRKLAAWTHEREWRAIREGDDHAQKIGKLTGVIIGYPYPKARKHPDSRWQKVREYRCRVKRVIEIAQKQKLVLQRAQMHNGEICVKDWE
jgi:hypothetical protein